MSTNYNKQALDFLESTNTTLEVKEATPQKATSWGKDDKDAHKHINYTVTLKNDKHSYTFDYWGSIHDYEIIEAVRNYQKVSMLQTGEDYKREDILRENQLFAKVRTMKKEERENYIKENLQPKAYDILACLSPMYEDTFEDFCASFGYDTDSRTAGDTYKRCIEQDRQLHKLFTHEQLEQLTEII